MAFQGKGIQLGSGKKVGKSIIKRGTKTEKIKIEGSGIRLRDREVVTLPKTNRVESDAIDVAINQFFSDYAVGHYNGVKGRAY